MISPLKVPDGRIEQPSRRPEPKGRVGRQGAGAKRAFAHAPTQGQAERRAQEIVSNQGGGEVRIHGKDGRIRDSDAVAPGRDPNRPATPGTEAHDSFNAFDRDELGASTRAVIDRTIAGEVSEAPAPQPTIAWSYRVADL